MPSPRNTPRHSTSASAPSDAPATRSTSLNPGTKKRADAEQNIERIVQAAIHRLAEQPDASMSQIAADAGVGRVTLYAHFDSREAVISAALARAIADGDTVLDGIDLTEPVTGLRALIESSWSLTARASALLEAARGILKAEQVRDLHAEPERRVLDLIQRGQADGSFRDDMTPEWLASVMHHLMKGAAADVNAGRLNHDDVAPLLADTVLAAYRAHR